MPTIQEDGYFSFEASQSTELRFELYHRLAWFRPIDCVKSSGACPEFFFWMQGELDKKFGWFELLRFLNGSWG